MHQHVVPRWKGDTNFMPVVGDTLVLPEVLPDSWARLREAFEAPGRMTAVSPGIFKAYDVRGTYPDQIDEDVAYLVGRGFARVLRDLREAGDRTLRVAVGHDMRLHSPALARVVRARADRGELRRARTSARSARRWSITPSARGRWTAACR